MKTIKLFDKEHKIVSEYDMAVCIWETRGSNLVTYEDSVINMGQKVYNVKVIESGSIIFMLDSNDKEYYVTMFPQMFGFPTEDQMEEVRNLEKLISDSQKKINDIYENIKRTGHTDLK